jgi:enoyl-CoA hydratase/carnithine racemase
MVGPQVATAMALCRRRLDAGEAEAAGLVLTATTDEDLLTAAYGLARGAAASSRDLVLLTKTSMYEEQRLTAEQAMHLEEERQMWSLRLPATAEKLRSAGG